MFISWFVFLGELLRSIDHAMKATIIMAPTPPPVTPGMNGVLFVDEDEDG